MRIRAGRAVWGLGRAYRASQIDWLHRQRAADLVIVGADPTRDVKNLRALRWVSRGGVLRSRDELRAAVAATHGE